MMKISTINHRKNIFEHPDLTNIIGVPNYDTLHLLHSEIKSNALAVHSNLGGGQHGYLGLVVRPTAYVLLSNTPFFCPVHPITLGIPVVATHHAQDEFKGQYKYIYKYFMKREEQNVPLSRNPS